MAFRLQIEYRLVFFLITSVAAGLIYRDEEASTVFGDRETQNALCASPDIIIIQLSVNFGKFLRLMNKRDYIIMQ